MLECRVTSVPQSSTKRVKTNECLWEALKKAFIFRNKVSNLGGLGENHNSLF